MITEITHKKPLVKINEKMSPTIIIMKCRTALFSANVSEDIIRQFIYEASNGDLQHFLYTCDKYVDIQVED